MDAEGAKEGGKGGAHERNVLQDGSTYLGSTSIMRARASGNDSQRRSRLLRCDRGKKIPWRDDRSVEEHVHG